MAWLIAKAVWKWLRSLPWPVWAFLALVLAFYLYGEHKDRVAFARGLSKGLAERDRVQSNWDKAVERGKAAIAAKDLANAAAQAKAFADGQAIGENRARDQRDNLAAKDRLIADLRSGNRRLQDRWQSCLSGPQSGDAAALSGGPVRADELRGEIAAEISEGFDSDSRIARLIQFQDVLRQQCKAVGGAP